MTFNFPTRQQDDDGNWKITNPPVDPDAERQLSIEHWQVILNATRNGRPVYNAEARKQAQQKLQELGLNND